MENVIDDLYFGRIHPCERNSSPEEQQLTGELAEYYERLLEVMTEEQRVGLKNFKDYLMKIGVVSEWKMFAYGLRLGMRLAVEVLTVRSIT